MAPQPFAVTGPVDGRSCPVFTQARNVSSLGRARRWIDVKDVAVQREMVKPGLGDKVECTWEQMGSICRLCANPEGKRQVAGIAGIRLPATAGGRTAGRGRFRPGVPATGRGAFHRSGGSRSTISGRRRPGRRAGASGRPGPPSPSDPPGTPGRPSRGPCPGIHSRRRAAAELAEGQQDHAGSVILKMEGATTGMPSTNKPKA